MKFKDYKNGYLLLDSTSIFHVKTRIRSHSSKRQPQDVLIFSALL